MNRVDGHVVAQVSERWLAELWASLLNDDAVVRSAGDDDAPSGQEDDSTA